MSKHDDLLVPRLEDILGRPLTDLEYMMSDESMEAMIFDLESQQPEGYPPEE